MQGDIHTKYHPQVCTPFYLGLESHEIPEELFMSLTNGAQCTEMLTVYAAARLWLKCLSE